MIALFDGSLCVWARLGEDGHHRVGARRRLDLPRQPLMLSGGDQRLDLLHLVVARATVLAKSHCEERVANRYEIRAWVKVLVFVSYVDREIVLVRLRVVE